MSRYLLACRLRLVPMEHAQHYKPPANALIYLHRQTTLVHSRYQAYWIRKVCYCIALPALKNLSELQIRTSIQKRQQHGLLYPRTACDAQVFKQAGFYNGDCSAVNFLGPGVCDLSCGRCAKCTNFNYCNLCTDTPPGSDYTCAQQAS
jgi:hypothetical protein